jgi:hypothetical protein
VRVPQSRLVRLTSFRARTSSTEKHNNLGDSALLHDLDGKEDQGIPKGEETKAVVPLGVRTKFSQPLQGFGTAQDQSPDRRRVIFALSYAKRTLLVSDLSLSKDLIPSERWRLELRADAFNVFNHVNLALPESTVDIGGAGQITDIQVPMRQMQFGLHLQF